MVSFILLYYTYNITDSFPKRFIHEINDPSGVHSKYEYSTHESFVCFVGLDAKKATSEFAFRPVACKGNMLYRLFPGNSSWRSLIKIYVQERGKVKQLYRFQKIIQKINKIKLNFRAAYSVLWHHFFTGYQIFWTNDTHFDYQRVEYYNF